MENIFLMLLGVVCIVLGVSNRKGNIASLHYYHRKRVSEEDRLPFGRLVGNGTIIIGAAIIAAAILTYIASALQQDIFSSIGEAIAIIGLVIGLGFNFYAMIKYNKGVF